MLKLTIPQPCHEDWNKMHPDTNGRHCNACAKTVVDFTSMNDEEIKNYLLNKSSERVCGRFRTTQLHKIRIELPGNIFHINMPSWKRFLVASLLVFSTTLFSCETTTTGDIYYPRATTGIILMPADTIQKNINCIPEDSLPDINPVHKTGEIIKPVEVEVVIPSTVGIIAMPPVETVDDVTTMGKIGMVPDTVIVIEDSSVNDVRGIE